jgi:uncharacterized RDD family membrane protein YckC
VELDDRVALVAPEGISVNVVVAGLGSRAAACLLDTLIMVAGLVAVSFFASVLSGDLPGLATALVSIAAFMVVFGYFVLFEAFGSGRTPGKRVVGLRVLALDGGRASFWRIVIRNVVRFIDYLPAAYLVGMISILVSEKHQRVGDLAAGTMVVRERMATEASGQRGMGAASPAQWAAGVASAPTLLPPELAGWDLTAVTPADVAAIRAFLDRRWTLPPQARATLAHEFANRLQPRVQGPPLHEGPERFLEWIVYVKEARG